MTLQRNPLRAWKGVAAAFSCFACTQAAQAVVNVVNNADLATAIASADETIRFVGSGLTVTITGSHTIPDWKILQFDPNVVLVKSGSPVLTINCQMPDTIRQYFSGWSPGDVKGTMAGQSRLPEWWGAIANNAGIDSAPAINAAVQCREDTTIGNVVKFGIGRYYIKEPVDIGGFSTTLEGAGSHKTWLNAGADWDLNKRKFADSYYGANHQALIWMGGTNNGADESAHSHVRGFSIDGGYACVAAGSDTSKWISGISAHGYIGKNCSIEDVQIDNYTGYGIGCGDLSSASNNHFVNGLRIDGFYIDRPYRAPTYDSADLTPGNCNPRPIFIGAHSGVVEVNSGTLFCCKPVAGMHKMAGVTICAGGTHASVRNVHVEGCGVAVLVVDSNFQDQTSSLQRPGNVKIDSVDLTWGIDINMQLNSNLNGYTTSWPADPSPAGSATAAPLGEWSSVVILRGPASTFHAYYDRWDNVTITNISQNVGVSNGRYLLRDMAYKVNVLASATYGGTMAFYTRGAPVNRDSAGAPLFDGTGDPFFIFEIFGGHSISWGDSDWNSMIPQLTGGPLH